MAGNDDPPDPGDTDVVGRRIVAAVIDGVIGYGLLLGTYLAFGTLVVPEQATSLPVAAGLVGVGILAGVGVSLGYFVVLEGRWNGQTIGKRMSGIAVVGEDGSECDLGAAAQRNLLRVVDGIVFYAVGFVLLVESDSHQRLGDRVANTVVVRRT